MQESKFKSSNSLSIRVTSFVDSLDLKKSYFLIQKILNFWGLIISSIHHRNKATNGIKNFVIALCLKKNRNPINFAFIFHIFSCVTRV